MMSAVQRFQQPDWHRSTVNSLHLDCLFRLRHGRADLHPSLISAVTFLEAEHHPHFEVPNIDLTLPTDVKGSICF